MKIRLVFRRWTSRGTSGGRWGWKARVAVFLGLAGLIYLLYPLPSVLLMRWRNPGSTAFMDRYLDRAGPRARFERDFVPLERIAPILAEAVMVAEDDAFYEHPGFDLGQLRKSVEANLEKGRYARGGSTITMQLAKNLYLSPERSLIRKGREMVITLMLELCLSKARILELYLNLIEWGPGVYGAEAASRRYFGKSAAALDASEAATLAAAISAPNKSNPASPNARLLRKRDLILGRLRRKGVLP